MLAFQEPSENFLCSVYDDDELWDSARQLLDGVGPLRNVTWRSPEETHVLAEVPINFVIHTDGKIDEGAAAVDWHRRPFLHLFVVKCEDMDTYKSFVRNRIKTWVDAMSERRLEWRVLYIPLGTSVGTFSTTSKVYRKIFDKLKADVKAENVLKLDMVGSKPQETLATLSAIIEGGLNAITARISTYAAECSKLHQTRALPGWNFWQWIVAKEAIASMLQKLGLLSRALETIEDCIDYVKTYVLDSTSVCFQSLIPEGQNADTASPLDLQRQPFRRQIYQSVISEMDCRLFLFARQLSLLLQLERPVDAAKTALDFMRNISQSMIDRHSEVFANGSPLFGLSWSISACETLADVIMASAHSLVRTHNAAGAGNSLKQSRQICSRISGDLFLMARAALLAAQPYIGSSEGLEMPSVPTRSDSAAEEGASFEHRQTNMSPSPTIAPLSDDLHGMEAAPLSSPGHLSRDSLQPSHSLDETVSALSEFWDPAIQSLANTAMSSLKCKLFDAMPEISNPTEAAKGINGRLRAALANKANFSYHVVELTLCAAHSFRAAKRMRTVALLHSEAGLRLCDDGEWQRGGRMLQSALAVWTDDGWSMLVRPSIWKSLLESKQKSSPEDVVALTSTLLNSAESLPEQACSDILSAFLQAARSDLTDSVRHSMPDCLQCSVSLNTAASGRFKVAVGADFSVGVNVNSLLQKSFTVDEVIVILEPASSATNASPRRSASRLDSPNIPFDGKKIELKCLNDLSIEPGKQRFAANGQLEVEGEFVFSAIMVNIGKLQLLMDVRTECESVVLTVEPGFVPSVKVSWCPQERLARGLWTTVALQIELPDGVNSASLTVEDEMDDASGVSSLQIWKTVWLLDASSSNEDFAANTAAEQFVKGLHEQAMDESSPGKLKQKINLDEHGSIQIPADGQEVRGNCLLVVRPNVSTSSDKCKLQAKLKISRMSGDTITVSDVAVSSLVQPIVTDGHACSRLGNEAYVSLPVTASSADVQLSYWKIAAENWNCEAGLVGPGEPPFNLKMGQRIALGARLAALGNGGGQGQIGIGVKQLQDDRQSLGLMSPQTESNDMIEVAVEKLIPLPDIQASTIQVSCQCSPTVGFGDPFPMHIVVTYVGDDSQASEQGAKISAVMEINADPTVWMAAGPTRLPISVMSEQEFKTEILLYALVPGYLQLPSVEILSSSIPSSAIQSKLSRVLVSPVQSLTTDLVAQDS